MTIEEAEEIEELVKQYRECESLPERLKKGHEEGRHQEVLDQALRLVDQNRELIKREIDHLALLR